jgi:hypothetical protein
MTEVEDGGGERTRARYKTAPAVAFPVEERMLDDVVAETGAERRGEEPHQRLEERPHERPRASPSRFSATAAVRFSR